MNKSVSAVTNTTVSAGMAGLVSSDLGQFAFSSSLHRQIDTHINQQNIVYYESRELQKPLLASQESKSLSNTSCSNSIGSQPPHFNCAVGRVCLTKVLVGSLFTFLILIIVHHKRVRKPEGQDSHVCSRCIWNVY